MRDRGAKDDSKTYPVLEHKVSFDAFSPIIFMRLPPEKGQVEKNDNNRMLDDKTLTL